MGRDEAGLPNAISLVGVECSPRPSGASRTAFLAILDAVGVEGVSLMRAPVPGEPVVYGLG